ncbi:hypothetical protein C4A76_12595 [Brevibacillus laterosporus]|nr:hypothetical protein C4A76_12595 [Brevibacillus laterosporus]
MKSNKDMHDRLNGHINLSEEFNGNDLKKVKSRGIIFRHSKQNNLIPNAHGNKVAKNRLMFTVKRVLSLSDWFISPAKCF